MMRGLFRNAVYAVIETACAGIAIFLLYHYAVAQLGVKAIGAWSLAAATTSVSRIADIGVGNALLRFVPAALAHDRKDDAIGLIETALATIAVLYFLILLLGEPVIALALRATVEPPEQPLVLGILPYVLFSFWLSNLGLVFLCALAGVHRYDQRSIASIFGVIVQLGAAIFLIPRLGLLGLVWSQVLQNLVLSLAAWLFLRQHLAVGLWPSRFTFVQLRNMLEFSAKLQLSSIAGFFFEPTTKMILSSYAGLAVVGYYEMASRMVTQVRSLLVSAVQVSTPALASLHEQDKTMALQAYVSTTQATWLLTFPLMATFAAMIPAITEFWLGHKSVELLTFALILTIGWTINLLCAPAFFMGFASGYMRGNVWGWAIIAFLNLTLGIVFGAFWGAVGVVVATVLALAAGSVFMLVAIDRKFGGVLAAMFTPSAVIASAFPLLGSVVAICAYDPIRDRFGVSGAIVEALATMMIAISLFLLSHPQALLSLKAIRTKIGAVWSPP